MKTFVKILAVAAALTLTAVVLGACGGNSGSATESKADAASSQADATTAESKADSADVDYSKPDVTIEDGDFDAMKTFASELQNGQNEGKVVKVTGISARSSFGAKATISEQKDSEKIGTTYVITGVDSVDGYPADDAKVEITGVVTKDSSGLYCIITVPADKVVVK